MGKNWVRGSKTNIAEKILISLEDSTWTPELHHSPSSCDLKLISAGWKWAWQGETGFNSNHEIMREKLKKSYDWNPSMGSVSLSSSSHYSDLRQQPLLLGPGCVSCVCVSVCEWHAYVSTRLCLSAGGTKYFPTSTFTPSWSNTENDSDSGRDRWALLPVAEADGCSLCDETSSWIRNGLQRRNLRGSVWKRISVTKNPAAQFDP